MHESRNRIPPLLWVVLASAFFMVVLTLCKRPQNRLVTRAKKNETFERLSARQPIWMETDCQPWDLLFSPNDRYLAATVASVVDGDITRDYRVLVFDLASRKFILDVPVFFKVLVCFSSRSDEVAIFGPKSIRLDKGIRGAISIYRTVDGAIRDKLDITEPGWWQTVVEIGISDESRCVAAEFVSSRMNRAWDRHSKQPVTLHAHRFQWSGRSFSSNRNLRFQGGWPGPGIRIVQSDTGKVVSFCLWETGPSAAPAFSPDSRMLAAAYPDGKFVVWDIRETEGRPILQKGGFENCTAFAMSHDMKHLAIADRDGTIRIEPLEIAELQQSLETSSERQHE